MSKKSNINKRIAMFSVHSDPLAKIGASQSGGQNIYVHELSRWLSKNGWRVDVFCRWTDKKTSQKKKIGNRINVIRMPAGDVKILPKEEFLNHLENFFTNFLTYKQENNIQYDIIHGHYWDGGLVAMHAQELLKIPFVQTFHSLGYVRYNILKKFQQLPSDQEEEEFEKRFEIEKNIIQKANKIVASSPYEEDDLIRYYGAKNEQITVLPAGVDTKKFTPQDKQKAREHLKIKSESRVLLYVGRLEWRKGIGTLITALKSVIEKDPDGGYQLIIVGGNFKRHGDPNDKKEYQRLIDIAKEYNLAEIIRFDGSIPQNKLNTYYAAADVCVVPSYYEPFGIVPLEAMAAKLPVIASATGGLQFTVLNSETGLSFTPRDPFALAEKILLIFNENELRERMVTEAYNRVTRDFNWKLIAHNFDSLYQQVIKDFKP